jgi:hypothetical protein
MGVSGRQGEIWRARRMTDEHVEVVDEKSQIRDPSAQLRELRDRGCLGRTPRSPETCRRHVCAEHTATGAKLRSHRHLCRTQPARSR